MGGKRCAVFLLGASMRVEFANKGAFAFFTGLSSDADVSEGRFAAAVAAAVALSEKGIARVQGMVVPQELVSNRKAPKDDPWKRSETQ